MPIPTKTTRPSGPEVDDALDAAARGVSPTSDDAALLEPENGDETETDAIGKAAGLHRPGNKPLGGSDEIADRDSHRWELDPASAEDSTSRR